jgi:hypothetical protein
VASGPARLDLAERRPRARNARRVLLHFVRQVREQLADRAAEMLVGRAVADGREPVVDAQEAQVEVEQRDRDRSVRQHHVEQTERLPELRLRALEPRAQGEGGRAQGPLLSRRRCGDYGSGLGADCEGAAPAGGELGEAGVPGALGDGGEPAAGEPRAGGA